MTRVHAVRAFVALAAATTLLGLSGTPTGATATSKAFVRVDQVGYELGRAPMRAYLMATAQERGARFVVQNTARRTVYSGTVPSRPRTWGTGARTAFRVYPLDFLVHAPGRYRVLVVGHAPATSPGFEVASAARLYEPLLGDTLFYYRSVRDGPGFVRGPLSPAPAHLNDRRAVTYDNPPIQSGGNELLLTKGKPLTSYGTTIDASGGHWDAGDNMKYVETESYATALMQIGVRDFPRQLGSSAPTVSSRAGRIAPRFGREADFGMSFLSRMWDDRRKVLYFQVGDTQDWKHFPNLRGDYDFWRLPQVDDTAPDHPKSDPKGIYRFIRHRPVFVAEPAGSTRNPAGRPISPNLAGRLAADFALYAQLHWASDPAAARRALRSGEDIFAQADLSYPDPAAGKRHLLTVIPYDGYPETVWADDMELGATELFLAARRHDPAAGKTYLAKAVEFARAYNALPARDKETLNLYDVGGLANFELARALRLAGASAPPGVTRKELVAAITSKLRAAEAVGRRDAFGFGRDWRSGDTTSLGDGLAVMADEADFLLGSKRFDGDARNWLGNMLGANPWGVSLIIGAGDRWTDCPQQQPANLLGSLTGGPHELWGAAVEGPTSAAAVGGYPTMRACPPRGGDEYAQFNGNDGRFAASRRAVYKDNVQSYTTTEPAIDLTATSFLAFSWRQAGRPAPLG
jgi:endoglucanase